MVDQIAFKKGRAKMLINDNATKNEELSRLIVRDPMQRKVIDLKVKRCELEKVKGNKHQDEGFEMITSQRSHPVVPSVQQDLNMGENEMSKRIEDRIQELVEKKISLNQQHSDDRIHEENDQTTRPFVNSINVMLRFRELTPSMQAIASNQSGSSRKRKVEYVE